jgi:hypothetical protein
MCATCGCGMPEEIETKACEMCGEDPCTCPPKEESTKRVPTSEKEDDMEDLGMGSPEEEEEKDEDGDELLI